MAGRGSTTKARAGVTRSGGPAWTLTLDLRLVLSLRETEAPEIKKEIKITMENPQADRHSQSLPARKRDLTAGGGLPTVR